MSFVERNKLWLLPVLGIGVAGVLWLNFRSTPSPTSASSATPAPVPSASTETPPPAPVPNAPQLGPDAWADLRPMNTAPNIQSHEAELTAQATRPLTTEQLSPPPPSTTVNQALITPIILSLPNEAGSGSAEPPPSLDFISRTPEGLRAWYLGVGFKVGQTILGTSYRVREIRPPKVVLDGPGGRVEQATFLIEQPSPALNTSETP